MKIDQEKCFMLIDAMEELLRRGWIYERVEFNRNDGQPFGLVYRKGEEEFHLNHQTSDGIPE